MENEMRNGFGFLLILLAVGLQAQTYTLGVGVYPGDPKENFAPSMRVDSTTYRNLALHRPAYHSSSYDFNLTAQLVTDGIKETNLPALDRYFEQHQRAYFRRTSASTCSTATG